MRDAVSHSAADFITLDAMAEWKVRIGEQVYPARDRDMIAEWFRDGRIVDGSAIYHGERGTWLSLVDYAEAGAPDIVLSTTPTLEGFRIVRYLGVESAATGALTLRGWTEALDGLRTNVLQVLRQRAVLYGGNAVVGITFDYLWAADLVPTLTSWGTIVLVEPRP
jgi:uncharacterized protein YbjQ (UPF0145 family)